MAEWRGWGLMQVYITSVQSESLQLREGGVVRNDKHAIVT